MKGPNGTDQRRLSVRRQVARQWLYLTKLEQDLASHHAELQLHVGPKAPFLLPKKQPEHNKENSFSGLLRAFLSYVSVYILGAKWCIFIGLPVVLSSLGTFYETVEFIYFSTNRSLYYDNPFERFYKDILLFLSLIPRHCSPHR